MTTGDIDPLNMLGAAAAVQAMREGDITAERYATALLARAETMARLNAFRTLEPDGVLEAARQADQRRARGQISGLLHGLPIPVKDSINTLGLPTSNGTRALQNFMPRDDAEVVRLMKQQGGIVMGKTNLHELSCGWTGNDGVFGPVLNPHDVKRSPGGSSGGSGAAVAARIAPLALGEDTLGSIRVPAACCGTAGFRPTVGRYPGPGVMPMVPGMDQVGPIGSCMADIVLFDRAISGDDKPISAARLAGIRIGVARASLLRDLDPEVARVIDESLSRLTEEGAAIVEIDLGDTMEGASAVGFSMFGREVAASMGGFLAAQGAPIDLTKLLEQAGDGVSYVIRSFGFPPGRPDDQTYAETWARRRQLLDRLRKTFFDQRIDVLAYPTIPMTAPLIGEDDAVTIAGKSVSLFEAMSRNIALASALGLPGLVLPTNSGGGKLPVGLELTALPGTDRALLSIGVSIEAALGTHTHYRG